MSLYKKIPIVLSLAIILLLILFVAKDSIFADSFSDSSQANFDAGIYSNTAWSTSYVGLTSGNTSGNFTSRVFDGGGASINWSNIAWEQTLFTSEVIAIDRAARVWRSIDGGTTWTEINADYNGTDANNVTHTVSDGGVNIYTLNNQDIWKSTNGGVSWTKINDNYNGLEGQNGIILVIDNSGNLYILEADEDVWKSTDGGVNWTKTATNINGATGNVLAMISYSGILYGVDVAADVWRSTDGGTVWTLLLDDYNGADANAGVDDMEVDSSGNFYILHDQNIWKSTNSGASWTKINSNYNGAETQDGVTITIDNNNNLYIVEADEDVWKSTDLGVNWTKTATNINGASGNINGLVSSAFSSSVQFQLRTDADNSGWGSFIGPDGTTGTFYTASSSITNLSSSRYFQYKAYFSTGQVNVSPRLSSTTITYATGGDSVAPADTTTLSASNATASSVGLSWTSPGDDNNSGTATTYDIRYSTSLITSGNWSSATQVTGEPSPSVAGSSESMTVSGLSSGTTYYFALKTSDEGLNQSGLSNVVSLATIVGEEPTITIPNTPGGISPSRVEFSGQIYPGGDIVVTRKSPIDLVYKNVPLYKKNITGSTFRLEFLGLISDEYVFTLEAKDKKGVRSGLLVFNVNLKTNTGVSIDEILFPPTINLKTNNLAQGNDLIVDGYATAYYKVGLYLDNKRLKEILVNSDGYYSFSVATSDMELGDYRIMTRSEDIKGNVSGFSFVKIFKLYQSDDFRSDLNKDNIINIADWSIFLSKWKITDPVKRLEIDINNDGRVDVSDLGILINSIKTHTSPR